MFFIFCTCVPYNKIFHIGTINLEPVTLIMIFDLLLKKNFNFANNVLIQRERAFIFSDTDQTLYRTRTFTEFWEVSIEHLRRVWHADRGRLLLRTPGPVHLGLAYVLLVETNPFSELVVIFTDNAIQISLGTFSILLVMRVPNGKAFLLVISNTHVTLLW